MCYRRGSQSYVLGIENCFGGPGILFKSLLYIIFIPLLFVLNCFAKPYVIRNVHLTLTLLSFTLSRPESLASQLRTVYTLETCCMKGASFRIKKMWIKQLCNQKIWDFATAYRVRKYFGTFTGSGARFSKVPETFRAARCTRLKLLVLREPLFMLRICEWNNSVIIRFEFLLWLSGCENFSGTSRNGPLAITFIARNWNPVWRMNWIRRLNRT